MLCCLVPPRSPSPRPLPPPAAACSLSSVASDCPTPTSSGCQRRWRCYRFDGRHRSTGGSLLGPDVSRGCGQCSGRSFSFSLTLRSPVRHRLERHAFAVEIILFSCRGVVISIALPVIHLILARFKHVAHGGTLFLSNLVVDRSSHLCSRVSINSKAGMRTKHSCKGSSSSARSSFFRRISSTSTNTCSLG